MSRERHHLSHAHVQMARELGMNPKMRASAHRDHPDRSIVISRIGRS